MWCILCITCTRVEVSQNERDLGVIMDSSLSYKLHVQTIVSKAVKVYGWLARSLVSRDKLTILKVYKCLVRPILEYGCTVWSPHRVGIMEHLEKVQRKITKLILPQSLSYTDRLKALQLPSLRWRRNYIDLLMVHKILHGDQQIRRQLFTLSSEVSVANLRRHRLTLYRRTVHCDIYKHHFVNRVIDNWNSLPARLLDIAALCSFKRNLKAYLLTGGGIDPYKWDR